MLSLLATLSAWEVLLIVAVIVLLFGATKIPQVMRGLGQGISEFKKGIKEGKEEEEKAKAAKAAQASPPAEATAPRGDDKAQLN